MQSFSHVLGVLRGIFLNLLSGQGDRWPDLPFGLHRIRFGMLFVTVWVLWCPYARAQQSTNMPWAAPGPGALVHQKMGQTITWFVFVVSSTSVAGALGDGMAGWGGPAQASRMGL
jgi:hypothetical protein